MSDISLSLPLFLIGILLMVYGWRHLRADQFHSMAFAVSLLSGFVTAGVVWRLDRLAPLAMVARLPQRSGAELQEIAPFAIYTVFATLVFSRFWNVPVHVSLAYGNLRFLVQLFNFIGLMGCTIAVSRSFLYGKAIQNLVQVIWWITAVNVLVVVYQYVVLVIPGLPQIGISRSYYEGVQLAAFRYGGVQIFRPGALVGEPKALAAVMVLYVVTWSSGVDFGNRGLIRSTSSKWLAALALVVILLTFSTTALVTLTLALLGVYLANIGGSCRRNAIVIRAKRRFSLILFFTLIALMLVALWNPSGMSIDLLNERYVKRLTGFTDNQTGLDQLALKIWSASLFRIVFGTGLGGISFDMMPHINAGWTLAYAPNIGLITVACDVGLLGLGLLLFPLARLVLRSRNLQRDPLRQTARSVGLCLCILWLVGSGPSLGLAVGIGLLASAASRFGFTKSEMPVRTRVW